MSRKYKFGDNDKLYFINFAVVYWIDLFIRNEYKEIMIESWKFYHQTKDLDIYGGCIITSHIHMIIGSKGRAFDNIPEKVDGSGWYGWMRRAGIKNGNNNDWQLWQQHNKPLEIINADMFYQKPEYIHMNPVVCGFFDKAEEYVFSSARDFYGKKGLLS